MESGPFTMLHRHILCINGTSLHDKHNFSITSYNVLAEGPLERNSHLYEMCAAEYKPLSVRHPCIIAELLHQNSDIITLQEVTLKHYDLLLRDMEAHGYSGLYCSRVDSLGIPILYKHDKFELIHSQNHILHELATEFFPKLDSLKTEARNAVLKHIQKPCTIALVKLRCKQSGNMISVGNIHVIWEQLTVQDVQVFEIVIAFNKLVQFAGGVDAKYVLCGDFNCFPSLPGYYVAKHGRLNNSMEEYLQKISPPVKIKNRKTFKLMDLLGEMKHIAEVKSSYGTVLGQEARVSSVGLKEEPLMGQEPRLTNYETCWEFSKSKIFEECLDYIWYSYKNIQPIAVLAPPSRDDIAQHGCIPSVHFPSDHVSIQAVMQFI